MPKYYCYDCAHTFDEPFMFDQHDSTCPSCHSFEYAENPHLTRPQDKDIPEYMCTDCGVGMGPCDCESTYSSQGGIMPNTISGFDYLNSLQYIEEYELKKKLELKSQSKSQESPTGSLRYNSGKYKMSTIPPQFLEGLAEVLTKGEQKYGRYNFAKGNYVTVPYDSAMRHINAFMKGQTSDTESGSHHLFHAAVNLMMMWLYQTKFPEMDDREFKDEV